MTVDSPGPGEVFSGVFGSPDPTHRVHAPGRVNLIGEHVDYNGLAVLPMAIQRRVTLHLRPVTGPRVQITNRDPAFGTRQFELGKTIAPYPPGDWGNYPKAAAAALVERFGLDALSRGLDGTIDSDLPAASGLSSSSALVVACALALLLVNEIELDRLELAELLAQGERYVGLRGGGMDQAVCLAAREGTAARIEFAPLRIRHCPIPAEWRFLVAFSLRRAEKSGPARDLYNLRTRECAEALRTVAGSVGLAGRSYPELLAELGSDDLLDAGATALGGHGSPLSRRFRHVVTEAGRVDSAVEALRTRDIDLFGRLLLESQRSLAEEYEVSTAELDELCELADSAGAAGARLTGAGLGGCAIAACHSERADAVVRALAEGFYRRHRYDGPLEDHLFLVSPSPAARVAPIG